MSKTMDQTVAAETVLEEKAAQSLQAQTMTISGNTVKPALERAVADEKMTQAQADAIWWFYSHCRINNFSLSRAAEELNTSTTTVYRLFSATYGAKYENIVEDIKRYRKINEERQKRGTAGFIETKTSQMIWQVCEAALFSQTIAMVWGDSQIGKTTALEEYAKRNNHGQTKYVRLPASAGVQLFMKELAKACFVSCNQAFEGMREAVMHAVDNKMLLIFDEIHQPLTSYQKGSAIKVFELIREIYDRRKCGVVLCGTEVWAKELKSGKLSPLLEQLRRRGTITVKLQSKPPKADLDKIAKAFGLPAADGEAQEMIKEMIHTSGLGMYVQFLQAGNTMAANEDKKVTWEHVVRAHDIIARLSQGGDR